ncbi:MAG: tRNA uridine-5-carboxymethylaminomethyl(34) synthesis GTPase MnmE, partial [Rhodoferax sp.]|nr:tRNA uridine-5-carboxymethylaminomethyl(34) synthesis GTPase MnmE [Rhodoferax sp.]
RAWGEIDGADVVLFLHDLTRLPAPGTRPAPDSDAAAYLTADARIGADLATRLSSQVPVIDVWNKIDLADGPRPADTERSVCLSARTGDGLAHLRQCLLQLAGWNTVPEGVYMARERHVQALQRVDHHVAQAADQVAEASPALDLVAEELRLAQNALGEITGAFGADDLLGVIFSRFCIGK